MYWNWGGEGNGERESEMPHKNWHRRHAIQIVAQLPESPRDALQVLELAKQLVDGFLNVDQPRRPTEVRFVSTAANDRCKPTGKPSSTPR